MEKRDRGGEWVRVNQYPTPGTNYMVTGLTEGNRYEFRVLAVNEAGAGKPSRPTDSMIARVQKFPPDAPDTPKLDRISKSSVTLSWRAPLNDGGLKIKGYVVQKKPKTPADAVWEDANSIPHADTTYTVR